MSLSRRSFLLSASGAAASGLVLPRALAANELAYRSTSGAGAAKYLRVSATAPEGVARLQSYAKAVTAMLKLPPTDPRNWYRNAMIHLLDCPHGNWWFLPWHRGYLGWFERTCRELSGDAEFALPYWDWTATPEIPLSMFQGVLSPTDPLYQESFAAFQSSFGPAIASFWSSLDSDQIAQLKRRDGFANANLADFWSAAQASFSSRSAARTRTPADRGFDPGTLAAVSIETLRSALAPSTYEDFGSEPSQYHSQWAGLKILESQPHNLVHNRIGGFMGDFLSPVDPIFFLHHANIDRIWDVWTRKQIAASGPIEPENARDRARWQRESFLFYVDANGQRVEQRSAGDYVAIGSFDYGYTRGSGETFTFPIFERSRQLWNAAPLPDPALSAHARRAVVMLPDELLARVADKDRQGLFARIELPQGTEVDGVRFDVLVNPPVGSPGIGFEDASFAGSFALFGSHGRHSGGPLRFTVALDGALARLQAAGRLGRNEKLDIRVVAVREGISLTPLQLDVSEISVGSF